MPSTDDILSASENVLHMSLHLSVLHDPEHTGNMPKQDIVTGCVQISGEWTGAVLLKTTMGFATQAASNLLALPLNDVQHNDRQDAMAELANMIGGSIKSILPGPSYLSLPSVRFGKEFDFRLLRTSVVCEVPMVSAGEPLHVVISRFCQHTSVPVQA